MARQVVFVISVDIDNKIVFINDDVLTTVFEADQSVWDTEAMEWRKHTYNEYQKALRLLNTEKLADD